MRDHLAELRDRAIREGRLTPQMQRVTAALEAADAELQEQLAELRRDAELRRAAQAERVAAVRASGARLSLPELDAGLRGGR